MVTTKEAIEQRRSIRKFKPDPVPEKHIMSLLFRDTDLQEYLLSKGKDLVFCGMMSHMCIDTTVRAAFDKGYACTVAQDVCATRNVIFNGLDIPANHVHGSYMAALGAFFAKVSSADSLIAKLGNME